MSRATPRETVPVLARLEDMVRREWVLYVLSAVITSLVTAWALKLWRADWTVPFYYQVDAILNAAWFKTVVETGWYESQPLLNAPAGQVFHDWKIADNLGYAVAKFFALVIEDPNVILNLYYVLGFPMSALAALWFLRLVGVSRVMSVALSVLYAIAPYHFARAEYHLFLASYFCVPLAMGVVYLAIRGRPLWSREKGEHGWRSWVKSPAVFTTFALALVASANSYYAFFTVLFIALAGFFTLVRTRDWRLFLGAAVAGIVTVLVMIINMLPDMIYSWENGSNSVAVARSPFGIEVFSLKLAQLVLPVPGHRISILSDLRQFYTDSFPTQGENPSLGFIAAVGFLALLGLGLYLVAGIGRRRGGPIGSERIASLGALSALTIFAFLLATTGGISSILGYLTSDLRAWNRISIVIALFALAAVGLILDAAIRWAVTRLRMRSILHAVVASGVAVLLLLVGYLDQVTPASAPDYAGTTAAYRQDGRLVASIERTVGADALVVQLPYREFPESTPVNNVSDTDQIKPYLHSSTLSWTGGGIKGRPTSEWVRWLQMLPVDAMTESAASAGFDGLLVDRQSYGGNADAFVSSLRGELGAPAVTSDDGRYEFYSLAPALIAARERFSADELDFVGSSIVNPVLARLEPDVQRGFSGLDRLKRYEPKILLENPRATSVAIEVVFTFSTDRGPGTLRFTNPDGSHVDAYADSGEQTVTIPVVAEPGRSYIDISVAAGEPFPEYVQTIATVRTLSISTTDIELRSVLGLD